MGKSTISMAMFNSFWYVYQRVVTIDESGYGLALHSLDIPKRFQHAAWAVPCRRLVSKNMFATTRTLLHTYKRHDDDHHHHHHHHIMITITLKLATPSEQYDDWGNNINFIFIAT